MPPRTASTASPGTSAQAVSAALANAMHAVFGENTGGPSTTPSRSSAGQRLHQTQPMQPVTAAAPPAPMMDEAALLQSVQQDQQGPVSDEELARRLQAGEFQD